MIFNKVRIKDVIQFQVTENRSQGIIFAIISRQSVALTVAVLCLSLLLMLFQDLHLTHEIANKIATQMQTSMQNSLVFVGDTRKGAIYPSTVLSCKLIRKTC